MAQQPQRCVSPECVTTAMEQPTREISRDDHIAVEPVQKVSSDVHQLPQELWYRVFSFARHLGPLVVTDKYLLNCLNKWRTNHDLVFEYLLRFHATNSTVGCEDSTFVTKPSFRKLSSHPLFLGLGLDHQSKLVHQYCILTSNWAWPLIWGAEACCLDVVKKAVGVMQATKHCQTLPANWANICAEIHSYLRTSLYPNYRSVDDLDSILAGAIFHPSSPVCCALHAACSKGHLEVLEYLLDECDPGFQDLGWPLPIGPYPTLLMTACQAGRKQAVQLLLKKGASVHETNFLGHTPLKFAWEYRHADAMQVLIEAGANVALLSDANFCALHTACQEGNLRMVELLVKAFLLCNIPVNDVDPYLKTYTPMYYAICSGNLDIVRVLLQAQPNIPVRIPRRAFNQACSLGRVEVVEWLLSIGRNLSPDVFKRCYYFSDSHGHTPLISACKSNLNMDAEGAGQAKQCCIVDMLMAKLLEVGADVGVQDNQGLAAIHWVCGLGNPIVVKCMLQHCPELAVKRDAHGRTPLHYACFKPGSVLVAKVLLEYSDECVNVADKQSQTPLSYAFEARNVALIDLLASHGASRVGAQERCVSQ